MSELEMSSLSLIEKNLKGIFLEYFKWYEKANKKFEKFAVLMQVGDFYEIYGYELPSLKLGNIRELQKVLNCHVTKKNGAKQSGYSNPLMAGFPLRSIEVKLDVLKQNYYVIYVINQKDIPGKAEKSRDEAIIISPGTNINPIGEDNTFILSIYLERFSTRGKYIKAAGISYIDISTGKSFTDQFEDHNEDFDNAFSQVIKTLTSTNPKEVILYNKNLDMTEDEIIQSLNISSDIFVRYFNKEEGDIDKRIFDIKYQEMYLMKIYKAQIGMLNVIDYLGIGRKEESRHSFMVLLNIIEKYQPQLLNDIEKPRLEFARENMILDNTTIKQLDILSNGKSNNFRIQKYTCIFNVINFTKTSIGYRYLKHRITNPEMNGDKINFRYDLAGELLNNKNYKRLDDILSKTPDFERIHRKINLKTIKLKDFCILDKGYNNILKFYSFKTDIFSQFMSDNIPRKELSNYIKSYKKVFNVGHMNMDSFGVSKNIFKPGVHKDLDILFVKRNLGMNLFERVQQEFSNFCKSVFKSYKTKDVFVKIEELKNSKYLKMTESKYKKMIPFKNKFKDWKFIIGDVEYSLEDFVFEVKTKGKVYKICHKDLDYSNIEELDIEIYSLTKKYFLETMSNYFKTYHKIYQNLVKIVGEIDFAYSNAKCADINNYIRPEIEEEKEAYFEIVNMRHPMIEKLCTDKFKPFDLTLNSEKIGLILSGINGTGKSSLMKTIGVLVTMAQAGYYVPCNSMKYSIFSKIMTRIVGNDNILTNSSSYQVEIKELISILNRADRNTLVLIDELCRGTEHISSVSLTVSTIMEFSREIRNKFIITTHLHKIFDFTKELDNVLIKHISIKEENNVLIYDRELKDGKSPTDYGLMVAKNMGVSERVMAQALKIAKMMMNEQSEILSTKQSRYNKNLFMTECEKCKTAKDLHTHHIIEQNEANENGFFKDGSHMNHISNLQVLCRKCHQDHHHHNK